MIKQITGLLWLFWSATGLAEHNPEYYQLNPSQLEAALSACATKASDARCDKLKKVALRVNDLAYEIRVSPQAFGQKILALEEEILNAPSQSMAVLTSKQELQERLAIVKWLESPEG